MAGDRNHNKNPTSKTKTKPKNVKVNKVPNRSGFNRNYFTLPHPLWMLIITFGIWLLVLVLVLIGHVTGALLSPPPPESHINYCSNINLAKATTFAPHTIPDILGPIATFGKYMSQYHNFNILLCYVTVILHCLEAAYAGKVCYDRDMTTSATVKWVASTFLFGFSSLSLRLLPYKPDRKAA